MLKIRFTIVAALFSIASVLGPSPRKDELPSCGKKQ
jgi:hypothetical protein